MSEKTTIRITNLTDVPSDDLKRAKMEASVIAIGNQLLNPGESKDFEDTPTVRRNLESYAKVGAACAGDLPPSYRVAKDKASKASAGEQKAKKSASSAEGAKDAAQ